MDEKSPEDPGLYVKGRSPCCGLLLREVPHETIPLRANFSRPPSKSRILCRMAFVLSSLKWSSETCMMVRVLQNQVLQLIKSPKIKAKQELLN